MANEISVSGSLSVTNGKFKYQSPQSGSLKFDQTTAGGGNPGTVNIGTSDEVISLGDISTPGWCWMKNLDDTNYVDIGPTSAGAIVPMIRMEAGETAGPFRLNPSLTLRGQANTAAVDVLIHVMED